MIQIKYGNILSETEGVICHGVNCKNKFGSGLAKQIAQKYPTAKEDYHSVENKILGQVKFSKVTPLLEIAHCFTQEEYGYDSRKYADLNAITVCLTKVLEQRRLYTVFVPLIGCGLGGLSFERDLCPMLNILGNTYNFTFYCPRKQHGEGQ